MNTRPAKTHSKKIRAPGPRENFLLGSLMPFRRDAITMLTQSARDHGDIVRFRLGPMVVHLVNRPEYVEHVLLHRAANYDKQTRSVSKIRATCGNSLLSSDGEMWLRHRRLIQPVFRQQHLEQFVPVITETTTSMLETWDVSARSGAQIDIVSEMMHLTLKIAARILFGTDMHCEAEVVERSLTVVLQDTWRRLESLFDMSAISPALHRPSFRRALQEIDAIVYRIINSRRQAGAPSGNLLSRLLDAHDSGSKMRFSDQELRDAVVTLLLAGHETTANALASTFYLLSQSPKVEEHVCREVNGFNPATVSASDLTNTGRVFAESIRLYPSVWILERRVIADDEIGGYHIPAGSTVVVSPWVLHRHPEFWPDAEQFDPERFSPEQSALRPSHAWIPFGIGPHQCIGQHMASLVAKQILGMVYRQFRLRLVPGQPIKLQPGITLRHAKGLRMTLEIQR